MNKSSSNSTTEPEKINSPSKDNNTALNSTQNMTTDSNKNATVPVNS